MNSQLNAQGGGGLVEQGNLTRILSLLGGPVRMEIIRYLALGPRSVGTLAEEAGQSIGLVSHNLRLLREAGLVACTPRSRQRIYSLASGIRVRYGQDTLDLSVHVAAEGSLTLSVPAPGIATSTPDQGVEIHVRNGLNDSLERATTLDQGEQIAKRA